MPLSSKLMCCSVSRGGLKFSWSKMEMSVSSRDNTVPFCDFEKSHCSVIAFSANDQRSRNCCITDEQTLFQESELR